jgi:hypothetical protein
LEAITIVVQTLAGAFRSKGGRMDNKQAFQASETEMMSKLVDTLANDKKFSDSVTSYKPGDEIKLKEFLGTNGFAGTQVRIFKRPTTPNQPPPPHEPTCYEVCLCSTVIPGLCVCVRYCS